MSSRVIHFEIPADDPQRAVDFYTRVFDWTFQKWAGPQDYWLITTGASQEPGINGGLLKRQHPGMSTVNTVQVTNLDQTVAQIEKAGGHTVVPRMAIPGVGHLAYCSDTENNVFGVMQPDAEAK
jgi:predicted enzyme related to lactoylglutathione lyase